MKSFRKGASWVPSYRRIGYPIDMDENTKRKISATMTGTHKSQETRARMAAVKLTGPREASPAEFDAVYERRLREIRAVDEALEALN